MKIKNKSLNKRAEAKTKSLKKRSKIAARAARKFRTVCVEANKRITIAENINPCLMVVKNYGSGDVKIESGYGAPVKLLAGQLRLMQTYDKICVEGGDENSLLEFEFMPTVK